MRMMHFLQHKLGLARGSWVNNDYEQLLRYVHWIILSLFQKK